MQDSKSPVLQICTLKYIPTEVIKKNLNFYINCLIMNYSKLYCTLNSKTEHCPFSTVTTTGRLIKIISGLTDYKTCHGFGWDRVIFFIKVHMILWFGYLIKILVITH